MTHQAQPPDSGVPGGWLPPGVPPPAAAPPPTAPGVPPPAAAPTPTAPGWGQPPPWQSSLYYSYREPGNDAAVAGFCLAIAGVALLLFTFGLACVITLPMAISGIALSVRGRRRVDRGETRQHGGLARAGVWLGVLAIVASIGAGVGWTLAIVNGHAFDTNTPAPDRQNPAVLRAL